MPNGGGPLSELTLKAASSVLSGVAVKELDGPARVPDKLRYRVQYQRFGRYEIAQTQSPKQSKTQSSNGLIVEGQ